MKRSEINGAIAWAEQLLAKYGIRLPRYAGWDLDKWAENKDQIEAVRERMLGWDVTDSGAVLYTLRNSKPCRERCIIMREGQLSPVTRQRGNAELINRAGGVLRVRFCGDEAITVQMDGIAQEVVAGEELYIYNGDSLSLEAGICCSFGPAPGYGDLVLCELAEPGCDATFREIDEDERVRCPLCFEYAKLI